MKTFNRWLDRFSYDHPRFGVPNLMIYFIIANVVIFVADFATDGTVSGMLELDPAAIIYGGQIWRLVTFVLVPTAMKPIWFIVSMFFYYFLGTTMEREWGKPKFSLFYLTGALLTILAAFLSEFFFHSVWPYGMGLYYIHQSLFLAFATLYPDMGLRIYFVIPIKAKWMAALWLFLEIFEITQIPGGLILLFLPMMLLSLLSAIANYLLYFWQDIGALFGRARAQRKHMTSPQTINFQKAQKKAQERKGYLRKCAVCGLTDAQDPTMEFRFCSKCNGYYCYCMKHINDHVHVK